MINYDKPFYRTDRLEFQVGSLAWLAFYVTQVKFCPVTLANFPDETFSIFSGPACTPQTRYIECFDLGSG